MTMTDHSSTNNASEQKSESMATALGAESVDQDEAVGEHELLRPKVHFRFWQTLGLNFSLTCTAMAIGAYLSLIQGLGGFPYFFWCFVFAGSFQLLLGVTVAELASAMPHSSGPAYWVKVLSPPKYSQFLEYLVGWLTICVYWFITTGNTLYLAETTVGWVEACYLDYTATQWQIYLVSVAWAVLLAAMNLPGPFKLLPHLMSAGIVLINCSWIFILIAMLSRVENKNSAKTAFVDVINESGWSSNGVVFFLAILPGILSVSGFDAVTHITDEVPNPKKDIPQVILASTGLSAVTGLAMVIMYAFCTVNPEVLLAPYANQPIINVLQDGLRSDALFHVAMTAYLVTMYIASVAAFTGWNRLYWSFSRANGLPWSRFTAKLSGNDRIPVYAVIANLVMVVVLDALGIPSLTALNAIFGSSSICALTSYSLSLFLAIRRGRGFLNPDRWLNLGQAGLPMQCIALVWAVFASVWLCFPLYLPVTPEYMNWSSVIMTGIALFATVYYLVFHKHIAAHDFYA
ncbi:hypothetical protein LTR84_008656 [Exophiala bonariae]|uniref:Amino acid permease/ SLC12A domain-containing protein n=1 Tax=Exophiala bonariae TaxID=1690606 RepID=A0AAV9MX81_9EURO|nr:hypothetical protein LTR84_008656 [Exophiala bonariae]